MRYRSKLTQHRNRGFLSLKLVQCIKDKVAPTIQSLLQSIGSLSILPISLLLFLARKDKRLRFLLPPNAEIEFSRYLGDIRVNVNTIYPVELEMLTGQYDPISSAVIRRFLTAGAFAVDIGANVGALTLLMAKIVKSGQVIAIEPGPPICERLRSNLRLNPDLAKNVRVFQVGAADKAGTLMWSENQSYRGNAGLWPVSGAPWRLSRWIASSRVLKPKDLTSLKLMSKAWSMK